jgi:hypothetical protein
MSKKTRDYLFFIFIGVFLILTVIISLYASGYRFNLRWPLRFDSVLQKTGALFVDTAPRGALISLNKKSNNRPAGNFSFPASKAKQLRTPNKIRNLLPGEYILRLERNGYWPFEKTVYVAPGQVTFAKDINLFRNDRPLLIRVGMTSKIAISQNDKYLYLEAERLIINLKDQSLVSLENSGLATSSWQWLDSGNKILVGGIVFDPLKNSQINYRELIGDDADLWQKPENDSKIYYHYKNSLNYLDPVSRTNTLIVSGDQYLAYQVRGDQLFYISAAGGQTILNSYALNDKKLKTKLILPPSGDYTFQTDNPSFISLYDRRNQTLYLIDPDVTDRFEKIIPDIITWQWINDNQLIYHNRWEIFWLDISQAKADLIVRLGKEITKILGNNKKNYLVFSTPDSLGTLDLKNDYLTTVLHADRIDAAELDKKTGTIYFNGRVDGQEGIYKLILE